MPLPGDVDVVLASELMEAGRAVQRGLVTPRPHDADRVDAPRLLDRREDRARRRPRRQRRAARRTPRRRRSASSASTWPRSAERTGSVISAVLFGALAGTGVLPFSRGAVRGDDRARRRRRRRSLKAFDAGFAARGGDAAPASAAQASVPTAPSCRADGGDRVAAAGAAGAASAPTPRDPAVAALVDARARRDFPAARSADRCSKACAA